MSTCLECGRRIFTPGLRTCPDCGARLGTVSAGEPAYASELGAEAEPPEPDRPAPAAAGDLLPARVLEGLPPKWLKAGAALLVLLFVGLPGGAAAAGWLGSWWTHRSRCQALCPGGVARIKADFKCASGTYIQQMQLQEQLEAQGCGACQIEVVKADPFWSTGEGK